MTLSHLRTIATVISSAMLLSTVSTFSPHWHEQLSTFSSMRYVISRRRHITLDRWDHRPTKLIKLFASLPINHENNLRQSEVDDHLQGIGVGIDLGTTNSAVAMMVPDTSGVGTRTIPTIIDIQDNGRTMPSVISFIPKNGIKSIDMEREVVLQNSTLSERLRSYKILTGNQALQSEQYYPQCTYKNVKRIIGTGGKIASLAVGIVPNLHISSLGQTNFHSTSTESAMTPETKTLQTIAKKASGVGGKFKWKQEKNDYIPKLHKQLEDATNDPALLIFYDKISNETLKILPEQISAYLLRKLYDVAENYHQTQNDYPSLQTESSNERFRVTRAVIGVPAYFTEAQRRATIRASELAGVTKVKLLPEPEAAALAYTAADLSKEELILVFDLGGGTFDVSILQIGGGVTEVIATMGNNRLGGTDFDKRVADYIAGQAAGFVKEKKMKISGETSTFKSSGDLRNDGGASVSVSQKRSGMKNWYNQASGKIPDIVLRVAELARISLSKKKVVEILVPLTEEGWKQIEKEYLGIESISSFVGPVDDDTLERKYGMLEGEHYIKISLDRKTFEEICYMELQMLLQPIREAAIMAGVVLPGEARPSFMENVLAMACMAEEVEEVEFWDEDENFEMKSMSLKGSKDGLEAVEDNNDKSDHALHQIDRLDIKAIKKKQQRGRKSARDIDMRERSFRKHKQLAMENESSTSFLGKRPNLGSMIQTAQSSSIGNQKNQKIQEGIHGRPLSRIVLVGGATRMPVIGKLLEGLVGIVPQRTVNPDEAVAIGCAIQCGLLDGENEGLLGGTQAVLSPMQAALMRALAKKGEMKAQQSL